MREHFPEISPELEPTQEDIQKLVRTIEDALFRVYPEKAQISKTMEYDFIHIDKCLKIKVTVNPYSPSDLFQNPIHIYTVDFWGADQNPEHIENEYWIIADPIGELHMEKSSYVVNSHNDDLHIFDEIRSIQESSANHKMPSSDVSELVMLFQEVVDNS